METRTIAGIERFNFSGMIFIVEEKISSNCWRVKFEGKEFFFDPIEEKFID